MSKRRTKKQKQNAKYKFALNTLNEAEKINFEPIVKRQFKNVISTASNKVEKRKNAEPTAKDLYQSYIGKDIRKSLIIVSLILALEVMIYLVWR